MQFLICLMQFVTPRSKYTHTSSCCGFHFQQLTAAYHSPHLPESAIIIQAKTTTIAGLVITDYHKSTDTHQFSPSLNPHQFHTITLHTAIPHSKNCTTYMKIPCVEVLLAFKFINSRQLKSKLQSLARNPSLSLGIESILTKKTSGCYGVKLHPQHTPEHKSSPGPHLESGSV